MQSRDESLDGEEATVGEDDDDNTQAHMDPSQIFQIGEVNGMANTVLNYGNEVVESVVEETNPAFENSVSKRGGSGLGL